MIRRRHGLVGINRLLESTAPHLTSKGLSRHKINTPAQQFPDVPLQANERKEADSASRIKLDENVDITMICCFTRERAEHGQRPHAECLPFATMPRQNVDYVLPPHDSSPNAIV